MKKYFFATIILTISLSLLLTGCEKENASDNQEILPEKANLSYIEQENEYFENGLLKKKTHFTLNLDNQVEKDFWYEYSYTENGELLTVKRFDKYDTQGVVVEEYRYNEFSKPTYHMSSTGTDFWLYDETGNLLSKTEYSSKGYPLESITNTYENSRLKSTYSVFYDYDGYDEEKNTYEELLTKSTVEEFDRLGRPITILYANEDEQYYEKYTYLENMEICRFYSLDNILYSTITTNYDDKGREISREERDNTGKVIYFAKNTYDKHKEVHYRKYEDEEYSYTTEFVYNDDGKVISELSYDGDVLKSSFYSEYDEHGNISKFTTKKQDGTIEIEYAPERTYDNEKIIKETFYNDIDYISGSKNGLKYLERYSH